MDSVFASSSRNMNSGGTTTFFLVVDVMTATGMRVTLQAGQQSTPLSACINDLLPVAVTRVPG